MSDSSAGELTNERSTSPPSPTTQGDVAHRISVQALVCGSPIDLVPAAGRRGRPVLRCGGRSHGPPTRDAFVVMSPSWFKLDHDIAEIASDWRSDRVDRQARRHLDPADFERLATAGFLHVAVPQEMGGL